MKVSEARTEFELRKKDIADVDDLGGTFLKWCNYINRYAYRRLANIMPEQYIQAQTYNVASSATTFALPTHFQDIIPQGTGMYLVDNAGNDTDYRLPLTRFGSSREGFYINATSIVFTGVHDSKTYKFRYIPLLNDLATENDVLLIPDRFSEHIMNTLDTCYNIWDEDQQAEVFNDERFVNSMNELISMISPEGQVAGLPDFSLNF